MSLLLLLSILVFILVLLFLVVVHELGHFVFAKLSGIQVDEFAFGFPPRLFSKKIGETKYSFNLIPLGGYVKIYGENGLVEGDQKDIHRSFGSKPAWQRLLVLFGGVLFNFIAAIVLFSLATYLSDTRLIPPGEVAGVPADERKLVVAGVHERSSLQGFGLEMGDSLVSIQSQDGEVLVGDRLYSSTLVEYVGSHADQMLTLELQKKNGTQIRVSAAPTSGIVPDKKVLGLMTADVGVESYGAVESVKAGAELSAKYTGMIFSELSKIITSPFKEDAPVVTDSLSGPIGLAHASKDIAGKSLEEVFVFTALLSLSLAVFNILPIPALDGGRIFFILLDEVYKKIKGKKIKPEVEQLVHASGFVLLLLMTVVISYFDILKLL
jgi:regulator of sigma E protease